MVLSATCLICFVVFEKALIMFGIALELEKADLAFKTARAALPRPFNRFKEVEICGFEEDNKSIVELKGVMK